MALYLKYRPQHLDQLIGQTQVKKTLSTAFQSGKLSHAYLFVGPRGTGKTSTARILAKMVNCQLSETEKQKTDKLRSENRQPKTDNQTIPCNQCFSCISITDGSSLDLIEIDAASNRGIDDIRTLRENIKLAPSSSKKKVYIIDEVHMLTTEAFNALLKTLEEPPKHALFILATTDVQKVPQTILSRVQTLEFKLATPDELTQALQKITEAEKIEADAESLKLIAKMSEGSFRDGVKLLDQIASSANKITLADVTLGLQTVESDVTLQLLEALAAKNVQESLKLISENLNKSSDAKSWIVALMDLSRSLMLIKSGVGDVLVVGEYSAQDCAKLTTLAQKFETVHLIKTLNCLQDSLEKLRYTSIPILPLELAVVEVCLESRIKNQELGEEHIQTVDSPLPVIPRSALADRRNLDSAEMSKLFPSEIKIATPRQGGTRNDINLSTNVCTSNDDVISPEIALLQEKWNFVLETIKPYNFSLEALLRLVKILECSTGMVVLEVPYSFHQRILEAPKSRDLLESVLSDVLGKPTRVSCVLATKPMRAEDIANVEVAADDEVIKAAAEIFGS